jgi:YesN/AraC family two-component response regulator
MDVKKFHDSRNKELSDFKKQYQFLKAEYASALSAAIKEPDPSQQLNLIQRVIQINAQLAEELHSIINTLNKGTSGFEPKELDDLTNDLIKYQKEYDEIEKSKDKVDTLKLIQHSTSEKLNNATFMYYLYIAILISLSVYVAYLVLTTTWAQTLKSMFTIKPSAPPW